MSNLGKGVTQQLFAEPALQTTHHGQNKYGRNVLVNITVKVK